VEQHWTETVQAAVLGIGCVGLYYVAVGGLAMLIESVKSIKVRGRENARVETVRAVEGHQVEAA